LKLLVFEAETQKAITTLFSKTFGQWQIFAGGKHSLDKMQDPVGMEQKVSQ
jgi:hypothetical protein